ncbi:MAG: HlyC/CorC family transporter [Bacteroidales bacterium]|nr:HlyC/CorC family transporter [Bacteroidales bacterium]
MDLGLTIILTLVFSAFFSGMEIAFVSANKLKIELDKSKGFVSAKVLSGFMQKPSGFIGAMLLGNNVALVIYGIAMASLLDAFLLAYLPPFFHSEATILLLQTILSTLIILILAEFLPKVLFRINPNALLNLFAVPAYLLYLLLYPLIYLFIGISEFILKHLVGIKTGIQGYQFTALDLDEYIRDFYSPQTDQQEGEQEIQMIQNVMDFHVTKVRECMVPRNEIVAADEMDSIQELHSIFLESDHSKILVYQGTVDHIIGYVHLYDLFSKPATIKQVAKPVLLVPETITASKVLNMLIEQRKSVAVIVDEFGGTAGMVTTEDLIEEIFGEIEDEFDLEEFTEKQNDPNEFIFAGRLEIDYLNKEYSLELPESAEYETLAGLIIHYHQSIPSVGEQISILDLTFTILEATETRIEKVQLNLISR